jgi:hypothetical protein
MRQYLFQSVVDFIALALGVVIFGLVASGVASATEGNVVSADAHTVPDVLAAACPPSPSS